MDIRDIFLARHAAVHSRTMYPEGWWKEEDTIWSDLTADELRVRPRPEHNSIAWLLWHMARCEDVAVNTMLRNTPEVLDTGGWLGQLGISSRHIGTGARSEEVDQISRTIELDALRTYRAAVGRTTRAWATMLDTDELSSTISASDVERAIERGAFGSQAAWVGDHWAGRGWQRGEFLFWLAIEHNWLHIGHIWVIRGLLQHASV
jgi:hypothetical protein